MPDERLWKTIGILGGMGPEATAEMYRRIVEICQRDYGAKYDSDFPPIFIYNLPLPDVVENKGDKGPIPEILLDGLSRLERAGCDFIAVPCNTVFAYINTVKSKIPLLNIVKETAKYSLRGKIKKVGLIATKNTIRNRLYEKELERIEVLQLASESQDEVNDIIIRVLSGKKEPSDKQKLKDFIGSLGDRGAEYVILGCTEIPLLISQSDSDIPIIDTLQVLAEATVKSARGSI